MQGRVLTVASCALAAIVLLESPARASVEPRWNAVQIATYANAIITGRVTDIRVGTDGFSKRIYTYVTVDVTRVLKGRITDPQIIVKQLGGALATHGLGIHGQAEFSIGEDVLLFLEIRPRDGSLYTLALWQGKWNVTLSGGVRTAWRRDHGSGVTNRWDLDSVVDLTSRFAADERAAVAPNTFPTEAVLAVSRPYELMGYRYNSAPISIDVQTGGQSGLTGGGFGEIQTVIGLWNAAGSSFRYAFGSPSGPARCEDDVLNNNRVTISFNDPCGEISDTGLTLAEAGSYYLSTGVTVNGRFFNNAVEGFVVNNNSATALQLLRQSGCFHDIQLHELGHVLGLDHSTNTASIMYPTIDNTCSTTPHGLKPDDISGLLFIYPAGSGGTTPPSSAPTGLNVTVNGFANIVVAFNAVANDIRFGASAATTYRLDFRQTPTGPVLVSQMTATTSTTIPIPGGVIGTFYVSVTGINSAGTGPTSNPVGFTIPGCPTVPAPTGLTGSFNVAAGVAGASWVPVAGASSYIVQAGTVQGAANLFNGNIGPSTAASASGLPPGFRAFVRVFAVNACGVPGPPAADILIQ